MLSLLRRRENRASIAERKIFTGNNNVSCQCGDQQTHNRIQMLQIETVEPNAFSILTQLMEMPELTGFSLVGGTALSLLYAHRKSVNLDLFSEKPFNNSQIVTALQKKFKESFHSSSLY